MSSPSRPVTILAKAEVLDGLFGVWDELDALLDGLSEAQWDTATSLPGWNVRDVVAHIVGTESMLQGAATPESDIDVSALEHVRNDIGVLNEHWVRRLRGTSAAELLAEYRAVTDQRRKALSDMAVSDWNAPTSTPAGPDTYGRFMRVRVFDCWIHEHDIRDAVDRPATDAELRGPASAQALDEVAASMGFVVGKLGGAPDGSRVNIELTGPLARTINVAVVGRGHVVEDFGSDDPTAGLRLDGLGFTRLCGGRTPAESVEVEYNGDEAVGRRIVAHLNYVI